MDDVLSIILALAFNVLLGRRYIPYQHNWYNIIAVWAFAEMSAGGIKCKRYVVSNLKAKNMLYKLDIGVFVLMQDASVLIKIIIVHP